ncbi:MAG: transcription antitermination factor NusB [Gammaproteobacteria bacterium]|nr:transcription antitermination factor NusB [Gammaproteobacteria bacterium]
MAMVGRSASRRLLVQALYQHQISGHNRSVLHEQYINGREAVRADKPYFELLLTEIMVSVDQLDQRIAVYADRPVEQIDPIERAVLWLGMTELDLHPDLPAKVVMNEAIELCRLFGSQDGYRYVNAVLDKAVKDIRS